MKSRFRHCLSFVLAGCLIFAGDSTAQAQKGGAEGPAPIVAGKVVSVRRAGTETFVGTLQPIRTSIVGSAVDGRVVATSVMEGDAVGRDSQVESSMFVGQPVIQLRTGTLDIEIQSAKIQLALSESAAAELEVTLPKEVELAAAKAAEAEARYQYAKNNFERAQRLGQSNGAISQGEFEEARSLNLATQQLAKASRIDFERLSETQELKRLQARQRVDAARQELARLEDLKAKYTIRAPFAGLVTRKMTEVGEWVTQGQPVIEVVQLDPIEMIVNTPQEHLNRLQLSLAESTSDQPLTAVIRFDGFDQSFTGTVKSVIAQADLRSRTFPVRLEIDNPQTSTGHPLQPGMLGKATLMIGAEQQMHLVKKDALVLGGREPAVYKIIRRGENITAVRVTVQTGPSFGDWIQVIGNLGPQDKVVLLGNERLRPGQALNITRTSEELPPKSFP